MDTKQLIIRNTLDEGLGSVYERVMLGELLGLIAAKLGIESVLEYECPFTRGFDNLLFLEEGIKVAIFDSTQNLEDKWKFEKNPTFLKEKPKEKYDLVWNFAAFQLSPKIVSDMKELTNKYILVFTPNILNYGTPFHFAYHVFAGVECIHAERGSKALRIKPLLKRYMKKHGIRVIKSGYIDIPWWPDTAASIAEVKKNIFKKDILEKEESPSKDREAIANKYSRLIEKWSFLEKNRLFHPFRFIFSHHQYVLGRLGDW